MAVLVPCLRSLRDEFNAAFPGRDKSSDGWLGDRAHASRPSDHNPDETGATPSEDSDRVDEVHALDVDADLRKPGWTMARAVGIIVTRHRTGTDNRLQNVIHNGKIYSRSWAWTARAYNGPNPHRLHAHFSARYTTVQENDTRPWGIATATPAKPSVEEYVMATRAEVKAAVLEALNEATPYTTGAGKRLAENGWSNLSLRGLTEYTLEAARSAGANTAAFQQEIRAALAAITADPGNDITLTDQQIGPLAAALTERLPTAATIAAAVGDEQARRMQD